MQGAEGLLLHEGLLSQVQAPHLLRQGPYQIFVMGKRTDFGSFFEKNKILPELQTNDIGV